MKCATAALVLAAAAVSAHAAQPKPSGAAVYDALAAMGGRWRVSDAHGHSRRIQNRCGRTGLFFECEQSVDGAPAALVVFLPEKSTGAGRFALRTQTLTVGADAPGRWNDLAIDGITWAWTEAGGRRRTIVTHSGPDYMHAEVQARMKGGRWITLTSESFERAP